MRERLRTAGIAYRLDRLSEANRGDVLRDFRSLTGLAAKDFAGWLGVTAVCLSRWENGTICEGPLCVLLPGLCRLVGVDYSERIGRVRGTIVSRVRAALQATPGELANLLRVSPVTVSRWECPGASIGGPVAVLFTLVDRDRGFWFKRLCDPARTELVDVLNHAAYSE